MLPTANTQARVKNPVPERVDVAIVGAGLGGLMAAAKLTQSGKRVAVLDSHYVAGGCATMFSRGTDPNRYCFDIGLHYVGDCGPNGRIPTMLNDVGVHVDWRPMAEDGFDTLVFPDLEFRIPVGLEAYRDRLVQHFPTEVRGIDRYVRVLREVAQLSRTGAPKGWKLAWEALTTARVAAFNKGQTLGAFLDTCTQNKRLRGVIAGQHGDYGVAPGRVSLMLHCGLVMHYLQGAYYPRGGGQVIADGLAYVIERGGSSIHLRHKVTSIRVTDGRASGLCYTGPHGETGVIAANLVISNADIKRTYLDLLPADAIPAAQRTRAATWEMGGAIFITCLAIGADISALGARNIWQFDDDDFDAFYAEGKNQLPPVRGCYITSATQKDPGTPGHAPPGVDTIEIMALVPGDAKLWGVADPHTPKYRQTAAYQDHKLRIEADLVARLERLFPGSTRDIRHRESASPVTHSRFTRASGGSGYGLAATPGQFLDNRPPARGPLPGLYFAGANTRTGHGITGALGSGVQCWRAIERDT